MRVVINNSQSPVVDYMPEMRKTLKTWRQFIEVMESSHGRMTSLNWIDASGAPHPVVMDNAPALRASLAGWTPDCKVEVHTAAAAAPAAAEPGTGGGAGGGRAMLTDVAQGSGHTMHVSGDKVEEIAEKFSHMKDVRPGMFYERTMWYHADDVGPGMVDCTPVHGSSFSTSTNILHAQAYAPYVVDGNVFKANRSTILSVINKYAHQTIMRLVFTKKPTKKRFTEYLEEHGASLVGNKRKIGELWKVASEGELRVMFGYRVGITDSGQWEIMEMLAGGEQQKRFVNPQTITCVTLRGVCVSTDGTEQG